MNSSIANSVVNSPNSSFDTEDTVKLSSSSLHNGTQNNPGLQITNDNVYQFDNMGNTFNPLPPPPITLGASFENHYQKRPSNAFMTSPSHTYNNRMNTNDIDHSIQASSHYSIFSNQHALDSNSSFHNDFSSISQPSQSMFKLSVDSNSDILNEYPPCADFMYNLKDGEIGNLSLESIPDDSFHTRSFDGADVSSQFLNYAPMHNQNFAQYPYTPTISDVYTPTMSEASSFTPNSTINDEVIRPPVPATFHNYNQTATTPPLPTHKISKKKSMSRMNTSVSKKNLVIQTQLAGSNPTINEPLQTLGVSPLCQKYKGLEIQTPTSMRPVNNNLSSPNPNIIPINVFRHNSDSSASSYQSENTSRKSFPSLSEVSLQSRRSLRKTTSKNFSEPSLPSQVQTPPQKPKKYTRKRLLPRSKNGCWICRIKHLKCDEKRPVCTSCSRFEIECDYSPEKPAYVTDKNLRKEKLLSIAILRKQRQDNKRSGSH